MCAGGMYHPDTSALQHGWQNFEQRLIAFVFTVVKLSPGHVLVITDTDILPNSMSGGLSEILFRTCTELCFSTASWFVIASIMSTSFVINLCKSMSSFFFEGDI